MKPTHFNNSDLFGIGKKTARRLLGFFWLVLLVWLGSCRPADLPASLTAAPEQRPTDTLTPALTASAAPTASARPSTFTPSRTPTASPTATRTSTPTATPTITPTPDPYEAYTIAYLAERAYGGGEIEIIETLAENSYFTRYLIRYPSDDLTIYGFMNVPVGEGPFPVVIALHGYIDPAIYNTIDYTTSYADAFARWGYLVLHPNLRNYPPSSEGDNLYRVGMAVDVFNLLALVGTHGGQPGPLQLADPANIGLWGHSMGGGVTTRVITVNPADLPPVKAAVLYAAMSGDEAQNFEAIYRWSDGLRGEEELNTPPETLALISPALHFERITAAIRIHHGRADELVPLRWSRQTCEQLLAQEKDAVCVFHAEQPHTFYGEGNQRFIEQTVAFFNAYLRAP